MEKARQAHFNAKVIDDDFYLDVNGEAGEITNLLANAMIRIIQEQPEMRRYFRRAARIAMKETRNELLGYWLDGWPFTLMGVAVLTGAIYGFCAVMHWLEVVLL